ncbi:hypothetical protein EON65_39725 [archaeon]|nr:MAG: hypothetical protein EON65_39725 [archaeon]
MLMKVAASEGHRLKISAKNCDFTIRGSDVKFSISGELYSYYIYFLSITPLFITDPIGDHTLHLDRPYDRAILIELLYIVAYDTNIDVVHFEYSDAAGDASGAHDMPSGVYSVVKFEEPHFNLCLDEEKELSLLQSFTPILDMSPHDLRKLARGQDHKRVGGFGIAGLKTILNSLRIKNVHKVVGEIAFTLDPFKTGKCYACTCACWIHSYVFFVCARVCNCLYHSST